jgi:serine/threonine-protein kinase
MSQCPTCGQSYGEKVLVCPKDGTVLAAAAPQADAMVGRVLDDKYRLDEKLNQGGMGAVYRGTHLMLNRAVAVKLIRPELAATQDVVQRFLREARTVGLLDHPNIAQVYDLGQTADGQLYIAMEFARGDSLKDVIRKEGPLAPGRVVRILLEVAGALSLAHRRDCVHRDLKPQNIMMARSDHGETAKLVDFGIAKMLDDASTQLTSTGFAIGTPQYMSPEQAAGRAVDARSDLYSLGVVLYEMLVGEVPFNDPSTPAVLVKHLTEPPPRFADRFPDRRVPPALEAVAMRCLEKDPAARFQNADEFAAALVAAAPPDIAPRVVTGPGGAVIAAAAGSAYASTVFPTAEAPTLVGTAGAPPAAGLTGAPTVVGLRDAATVHLPGTPSAQQPPAPAQTTAPTVAPGVATAGPRATVAPTVPPPAIAATPPPPASAPREDQAPSLPPAFVAAAGGAAAAHDAHATTRARHSTGAALVVTALFVAFVGAVGFVGYRLGYWDRPGADVAQTPAPVTPPSADPPPASPGSTPPAVSTDPAAAMKTSPAPTASTPTAAGTAATPAATTSATAAQPGTAPTSPSGSSPKTSPGSAQPSNARTPAPGASRGASPASSGVQAPAPAAAGPPQPPALPANPSVFFRCEGVAEVCGALRATVGDALQRASMTSLRRPEGADVTVVAEATEGPRRAENMFGTTMVTRTFTVVVEGDSDRFNEMVPMPGPATFSFDDRVGRARLEEQARLIASGMTDRIRAYWAKQRGGGSSADR